ncbi:MAG TPA: DNA replication and repair protein RecF [Candidatus Saccharimonadales bacterium]|nr:DNA replication and repair protein RecF [Candidatus Saccharimonadales bacterium]
MALVSIRLRNFRTYKDETFELDPGVNIIVGPNTSGKTNLLEALQLITIGKSHRGLGDDVVAFNKPWARLDIDEESNPRTLKIELTADTKARTTFIINKQSSLRLSSSKTIPIVLFEPNHLQLLTGRPQLRRDFLDDLIEQIKPEYKKVRSGYLRTLAQRNNLLKKSTQFINKQIFAWDVRLSDLAGQTVKARSELINNFNEDLPKLYKQLSQTKTNVQLVYQTNPDVKKFQAQYIKLLQKDLELDRLRGFTGRGPHRDDSVVLINNRPALEVASRGEIRTILLALKILEVKLIEKVRGQKPLLLLDDVFSELDGRRRQALTKFLKNYQTFITTTDADVVLQHFVESCHIIPLAQKH